jgi:arginine utilization regulatory protein
MSAPNPALASALKIFARFFDLIHQPITITDRDGRFIYYNQECVEIDGYRGEPPLGKHVLEVYTRLAEDKSTMLDALKNGTEYIGNYQVYYNQEGKPVDYQHTTVPLYDDGGAVMGVIEIGRDLSSFRQLQQQVVDLNRLLYDGSRRGGVSIVTGNKGMRALMRKARRLAQHDAPVMIVGETGTGKELFARLVHESSPRADKPFIALNCGALPAPLIESSLFGTVKGAFTGAENSKGYLEIADGGTLFLDELNAMPFDMQSRLLRFLQEKNYWKLGASRTSHADVRIVAALNESPTQLLREKRLRADLFYRLCVGTLALPPLGQRLDDIEPLALHFIEKHSALAHHAIHGIEQTALEALKRKSWPGNVRMLENVIVRSLTAQETPGLLSVIAEDDAGFFDSDVERPAPAPAAPRPAMAGGLVAQVEALERQLIVDALNQAQGTVSRAADLLQISRTTLHSKISRYGIRVGVVGD